MRIVYGVFFVAALVWWGFAAFAHYVPSDKTMSVCMALALTVIFGYMAFDRHPKD